MNKRETHIVTGMTRDLSASRFDSKFVVDARNIRITATKGNSTLLSVTNEKGTERFTVNGEITGVIIGHAVLNNTLVLFTTEHTTQEMLGQDRIYRLDFVGDFSAASVTVLFEGNLNFYSGNPLETLPYYETDSIQKVYWVDGRNQPRMININGKKQTASDAFDFNREISGLHALNVEKKNSGGEFPAGTIQYCFNYFNKFGQETNIVDASPLFYLSPQEKGLPADGIDTSSFVIKISGADSKYEYIRLYSIIRTSENATPNVRIVGDYAISETIRDIVVVDNGIIGSALDSTALLFIGGQDIIAGTFTTKSNTLFLGNIKHNVPSIGNLTVGSKTLKEYAKTFQTEACVFSYSGLESSNYGIRAADTPNVSGEDFYGYPVDNNRSSYNLKTFKARENYRLGFIAQYKTGQWSEAIWLGDFDETFAPGRNVFAYMYGNLEWGPSFRNPGFKTTIPQDVVTALKSAGFIRVAPVVVYPQSSERKVPYQGILSGTVFNVNDRASNSPYVQSDWSFRSGYTWERISHEIQCNPKLSGVPYPAAKKNDAVVGEEDFVNAFKTQYYRDPSILTFHSPDIEKETVYSESLKDLKLRIVGFSNWGFAPSGAAIESKDARFSHLTKSTMSYSEPLSEILNYPTDTVNYFTYHNFPLSYGGYTDVIFSLGGTDGMGLRAIKYFTYLWHRNGPLSNDRLFASGTEEKTQIDRPSMLGKKIISELRYARTTFFQTVNSAGPTSVNVAINTPKIVSEDSQVVSINDSDDNKLLYYGNIDKILTVNRKDLDGYQDYFGLGSVLTLDMSKGYPLEVVDYTSITPKSEMTEGELLNYLNSEWAGESPYPIYINEITGTDWDNEAIYGSDPVSIKYKSTKHLVFSLSGNTENSIYQLGTSLMYNTPVSSQIPFYWGNGNMLSIHDALGGGLSNTIGDYTSIIDNSVLVAELYRDFSTSELASRFGGDSDEAIANNIWVRCGSSEHLIDGIPNRLYFKEGDTYVGRYDCLKTFPYTDEDQNQFVSIYSTELESRVNLDARYDNNRGLVDNTYVRPTNFGLFNHPGYEQTNQYFTYKALDYSRYNSLTYPNLVSFGHEKKPGADIDAWTSVPMTATFDMKGELGEITKLTTFNDSIFSFQNRGVAQILFNERVQIPTSDGQPIEITNGLKYGGYRYLSDQIGLTNKWSLYATPYGIYFVDDEKNTLYQFNGQQFNDLSGKAGFRTWLSDINSYGIWNPVTFSNIRTWYDRVNSDLYFMTSKESLVYSEQIGNFISFMDYGGLPMMVNMNDKFLAATINSVNYADTIWELWAGQHNMFFDTYKPYWLTFISNTDPTVDKVFNNLAWRTFDYSEYDETDKTGVLQPMRTFDTLRVWHDHQDTGDISLVNIPNKPSMLKKKFNVFRAIIPRDRLGLYAKAGKDRIRNTWTYIQLSRYEENTDLMMFNDLDVDFFE